MDDRRFEELKRMVEEEQARRDKISALKTEIKLLNSRYKIHKPDGWTRNLQTEIKQEWYEESYDGHGPGSNRSESLVLDDQETKLLIEALEILKRNKELELKRETSELEEKEN